MPEDIEGFGVKYFKNLQKKRSPKKKSFRTQSISSQRYSSVANRKDRRKTVFAETVDPEHLTIKLEKASKTPEERFKLNNAMKNITLFQFLDRDFKNQVIDLFVPKIVEKGTIVTKQGDDGDYFFIIDSGKYEVHVKNEKGKSVLVKVYDNEGSFGEVALLYNIPRTGTVQCVEGGRLWAIDRRSFHSIVARCAYEQRKQYENLISQVPMLSKLSPAEKLDLADALKRKYFVNGECIVEQHDQADGMYFIENGTVKVIYHHPTKGEIELKRLRRGHYFGELGLINQAPRAASVYAVGPVTVAFLDRSVFERLLGPCMDVMKRNMESYNKVMDQLVGGKLI